MVLSHSLPLSEAEWQQLLNRLLSCPRVEYWYDQVLVQRASTSWGQVLGHLLARIDERPDDHRYDALPFDGMSEDLLTDHAADRRAALHEVLDHLAQNPRGRRAIDLPLLFWSVGGDGQEALALIRGALTAGESQLTAAELIIGAAGRDFFLENADWVAAQLDASPSGEALDDLRGALYGALNSGIRQGTAGQPLPEDVELDRRAREQASASRPGSRARNFWTRVADAAARDIRREVEEDDDAG